MIYLTKLVFSSRHEEFQKRLDDTIGDFQQLHSLAVEVQYAGQNRGGNYTALVIGRRP